MKPRRAVLLLLILAPSAVAAQNFDSGSDGSDGALIYAPGLGSVVFDTQGLDPDQDGVFHFTTIEVGAGTTLRFPADRPGLAIGKPIVWLSSGPVTITGTLDLDGAAGHNASLATLALPSTPGAGGFPGGAGGLQSANFPKTGSGPGGGRSAFGQGGGFGSHRTVGAAASANRAAPGSIYGNAFLFPLLGGSGGGGGSAFGSQKGGGGGAGGGAILIATSTTFDLQGSITSRGGDGGTAGAASATSFGGAGSGGGIRLMADTFSGTGVIDVDGGSSPASGGTGWVRLEAFTHSPGISVVPAAALSLSSPGVVLPGNPPEIGADFVDVLI